MVGLGRAATCVLAGQSDLAPDGIAVVADTAARLEPPRRAAHLVRVIRTPLMRERQMRPPVTPATGAARRSGCALAVRFARAADLVGALGPTGDVGVERSGREYVGVEA